MKLSYVLQVTGQPGIGTPPHLLNPTMFIFFLIGKTTYIAYVLTRRFQNKLPTAIKWNPDIFVLFDDQGAHLYGTAGGMRDLLPRGAWALSDSSASLMWPCDAFQESEALLIQTTSPTSHRWKAWAEDLDADIYVMDVWTQDEIYALLYVLSPAYHQREAQTYTEQFAA
jgi:hypothetical protein